MPIMQSRMLQLLEAAEAYQNRYKELFQTVKHICLQGVANEPNVSRQILIQLEHLRDYHPADAVIWNERGNYNRTYKDNDTKKRRLRSQRAQQRAEGILTTTPRTSREMPPQQDLVRLAKEMDEADIVPDLKELPVTDYSSEVEITDPELKRMMEEASRKNKLEDERKAK